MNLENKASSVGGPAGSGSAVVDCDPRAFRGEETSQ